MAPLPPRASPTIEAILAAYEAEAGDGFREHLGASVIGRECDRALWYEFRWVTRAVQGGRMLRLFETGRLEEERLVRNLRRVGVTVLDVDPDTGRQWHVQAHGGHFGGSLDGVGLGIPEGRRPGMCSSSRPRTLSRSPSFGSTASARPSPSTGRKCRSTCI